MILIAPPVHGQVRIAPRSEAMSGGHGDLPIPPRPGEDQESPPHAGTTGSPRSPGGRAAQARVSRSIRCKMSPPHCASKGASAYIALSLSNK